MGADKFRFRARPEKVGMCNPSQIPTARDTGGPDSRQVVLAHASPFDPAASTPNEPIGKFPKPRLIRNNAQALEALLLIVFRALTTLSKDASQTTHAAIVELTQILRRYVTYILAKWGIPNPSVVAEDVVQDLFVRLLSRGLVRRYDHRRSLRRTFLFGILRRVLSEAFRKLMPGRTVPLPADLLDPTPYADEVLAMNEIRGQVSAAIGRLRPSLAYAICARYGIDRESTENSSMSRSARDTRVCRAKRALREDLKGRFDP
jgi:DNA-directed RNA polymerase specialized sigma24 family protein